MPDAEQLREEAAEAVGISPREPVPIPAWVPDELEIGTEVHVEPSAGIDPFDAVIVGFSEDIRYTGMPVVPMGDVSDSGADGGYAVLHEEDGIEVVDGGG